MTIMARFTMQQNGREMIKNNQHEDYLLEDKLEHLEPHCCAIMLSPFDQQFDSAITHYRIPPTHTHARPAHSPALGSLTPRAALPLRVPAAHRTVVWSLHRKIDQSLRRDAAVASQRPWKGHSVLRVCVPPLCPVFVCATRPKSGSVREPPPKSLWERKT